MALRKNKLFVIIVEDSKTISLENNATQLIRL